MRMSGGEKKENLDVQVLTRLAREHKPTEGWKCVWLPIVRELTPEFKKCMKNTGLFLSFSWHREKANVSQNASGEHS